MKKRGRKGEHHKRYRHKRRTIFGISLVLLVILYLFKDASLLLRVLSSIGLLVFFYVIDHYFDLRFEARHYVYVIIFAVFGLMLSPLYYIYSSYDKIQHFILPMLFASIVFHVISKLKLSLYWKVVFTFFVTIGFLGIFEIGEYVLDELFDMKLQGVYLRDFEGLAKFNLIVNRIDDTMVDMFLGIVGSGLYTSVLYGYLKRKERGRK